MEIKNIPQDCRAGSGEAMVLPQAFLSSEARPLWGQQTLAHHLLL